jgi:tetratricopeptide (TPR) repeat protein
MPYREVGVVKNATKEAVIGVEYTGNQAEIKLHVTGIYPKVSIVLKKGEQVVFKEEINCTPENPYLKTVVLETVIIPEEMLLLVTNSQNNQVLVSYRQEPQTEQELPAAAQAAKRPEEVENNEQLYLTGLHIEQYRHATYVAKDYYEEGLRRDKNDARCNNALGLWYLRRGKPALAEQYLRTAVKTLTSRNPNPYDGEPYYNLGWALKMQGKYDVAYDVFYKCVWNDAWQHAGYLNLARIALMRGNYREAMELIEKSLVKNYHSHTARHAKVIILRKLGAKDQAYAFIEDSLKIDRFNFGCLFEKYLLLSDEGKMGMAAETAQQLLEISRNWVHNFIEYAFDYAHAGLYKEASDLLQLHLSAIKKMPDLLSSDQDKTGNLLSSPHCDITAKNAEFLPLRDGGTEPFSPMVYYYLGWFAFRSGNKEAALQQYLYAVSLSPDFCFPNRIEDVPVLQNAIELNPADAKAYYYLGNFWYDKRQYQEAIACWEKSVGIEDHFATVHRNLSLAYYNKKQDAGKALRSMEKAFALDDSDARILMELDQLHKKLNTPPAERLVTLQKYHSLVLSRDDLYLEWVTLYNQIGQYAEAKQLLAVYRFHPWEGGEGKVIGQHLICHIELAKEAILNGRYQDALLLLEKAESYPLNLGEGKLYGVQENDIHYLKGLVYELMGQSAEAKNYFIKATKGISEPVQAIFYNDAQPDKIFYQGLAWLKLGEPDKAEMIFARLKDFGKQHLDDTIQIDYFAVSLPDLLVFDADLSLKNHIHCLYLAGLGYLGEGNMENAGAYFNQVLKLDINHQGAATHLQMIPFLKSGVVMK